MEIWINCTGFEPFRVTDKPVVIGRLPECDYRLPHASVSRKHAVLGVLSDQLTIQTKKDLGMRINGKLPTSRRVTLKFGDEILIGPFVLRISATADEDLAADTVPISLTVLQDKEIERELASAMLQIQTLEKELKVARREQESEVWRGLNTQRESSALQKELDELRAGLEALTSKHLRRPKPEQDSEAS